MKRLCTICARGGSKGVPGKNIREIGGKPLIAHSILQAKDSQLFASIAVSSDSEEILETARKWGADIIIPRPAELATDTAAKIPVIRHAVLEAETLSGAEFDVIVDLDATSPLRTTQDICEAVKILEKRGIRNVITGMPARKSPYFNLVEIDTGGVVRLSKPLSTPITRRQDAPACYDMNASIYVWKRHALFESNTVFQQDTALLIMPEERSIDIDSELDFKIVELLMKERAAR